MICTSFYFDLIKVLFEFKFDINSFASMKSNLKIQDKQIQSNEPILEVSSSILEINSNQTEIHRKSQNQSTLIKTNLIAWWLNGHWRSHHCSLINFLLGISIKQMLWLSVSILFKWKEQQKFEIQYVLRINIFTKSEKYRFYVDLSLL